MNKNIILRICGILLALTIAGTAFSTRHYAFLPGIIGLAGTAYLFFCTKQEFRFPWRLAILLAAFIALGLLSSAWSVNPGETMERAIKTGGVFLGGWFFITLCMNYPAQYLSRAVKFLPFILPAVIGIILGDIVAGLPLFRLIHGLGPEFSEHYFEANKETATAIFLLPAAILAAANTLQGKVRTVLMICLPVSAVILLTQSASQSAMLAFLIGLSAFTVFPLFPGRRKAAWIATGALLIAGLWASPVLAQILFERTAYLFAGNSLLVESAASPRLEIWDFIGAKIAENPLTGYGMNCARFIEDFETGHIYYKSSTLMHPHNAALQLWLEFGITGALAGSCAIAFLLRLCYRSGMDALESGRVYFALFCMLFISALIGWDMWQGWWLGVIFTASGLTIAAGRAGTEKADQETSLTK